MSRLYHGLRLGQLALGVLKGSAAGTVAAPVRALARRGLEHGENRRKGVRAASRDDLGQRADTALATGLQTARATLERNDELERELRDVNRGLGKYDTNVQANKQLGQPEPTPTEREAALLGRRDVLENSRETPAAIRQARSLVAKADRNLASSGREFTDRDRAALIDQRRRDIEQDLPPTHERNLRFAGIDPRDFARGSPEDRVRMEEEARRAIDHDRTLLAAVPDTRRPPPARADARRARTEIDPDLVRARVREQHEIRRRERRRRRTREFIYRRR